MGEKGETARQEGRDMRGKFVNSPPFFEDKEGCSRSLVPQSVEGTFEPSLAKDKAREKLL